MPALSFLESLGPPDVFALLLALGITLTILGALSLRPRVAASVIALAAFVPVPAVALFSKQFNLVGWHAFMHTAPIYQIMQRGGGVPEEPLYAGGALRYPWVEHWLVAKLSLVTGLDPITQTLVAEALGYAVFLAAAAWLAATLTSDRVTIALAVLLSGFGISIFHMGFFAEPLGQAFPPIWLETRVVPVDKFLNLTATPLGYAAMTVAAVTSVRLVSGIDAELRLLALLWVACLWSALIHPLSWLGTLGYAGTAALVAVVSRQAGDLRRAGLLALVVITSSVLVIPYLRSIGASESSDGWSGVTPSFELFAAKAADWAFFLATFLFLAYLHRTQLISSLRERHRPTLALVLSIAGFSIAYLVVRLPGRNEYKFLLHLVPAAAALMALSLRPRLNAHRLLASGLLFLLLIPGGRILGSRPWFIVTDPARLDGPYLHALDTEADHLYTWVAANTPRDAVVLAADLRMPALGRRSLYIAVDAPWRGRDGWGLPRNSLLQWHVRRPDALMYRRQRLATIVLNPDWASPPERVMAAIQADLPGRPIFVHTTSPAVIQKLRATPGFSERFANAAGSIYAYSH
jgi:hypothetical protein